MICAIVAYLGSSCLRSSTSFKVSFLKILEKFVGNFFIPASGYILMLFKHLLETKSLNRYLFLRQKQLIKLFCFVLEFAFRSNRNLLYQIRNCENSAKERTTEMEVCLIVNLWPPAAIKLFSCWLFTSLSFDS